MFDFELLIGQTKEKALNILAENGYNDIECIINSKSNALCDSLLVCKVENCDNKIKLVLGEFYLNIKEL